MITLSPEAARHIEPVRVVNLYGVAHRRRALIAEARALTTHPLLADAWRDQARALVDVLENSLATDLAKIEAFERTIPPLEIALANEREAIEASVRARLAHTPGSLDRATQLRRRDDVEATLGVLVVRTTERIAAIQAVGYLPQNDGVPEGDRRILEMVKTIASKVTNRKFHPESTTPLSEGTWKGWLAETSDLDMMWIPLFAARVISSAEPEFEDARSEVVTLPRAEFVAELERFKHERLALIASKLAAARALVAAAAAQEGAAA